MLVLGNPAVLCAGEAVCPPYPAPTHGSVSSTSSTPVGQPVVISCNAGYAISRTGRASPVCVLYPPVGNSGGYDPALGNRSAEEASGYQRGAVCEPIVCGKFPAPAYGKVMPEGLIRYGERASIVCIDGFRPVGPPGSSPSPRCQSDGSFELGQSCVRIRLDCLSSVSTSEVAISDGHTTFQNQTCHVDTQYCVTAVKGKTVWRGCGPPIFKVYSMTSITPYPEALGLKPASYEPLPLNPGSETRNPGPPSPNPQTRTPIPHPGGWDDCGSLRLVSKGAGQRQKRRPPELRMVTSSQPRNPKP